MATMNQTMKAILVSHAPKRLRGPSDTRSRNTAPRIRISATTRRTQARSTVRSPPPTVSRARPASSTIRVAAYGAAISSPSRRSGGGTGPLGTVRWRRRQTRATSPPAATASTSVTNSLRSPVVRSVRSAWKVRANRLSMDSGLGIEVGNEFGLEPRDLVLEQELAALQPLQLQLVDPHVELQPLDHVVEVTMLDAQLPQFL